MSGMSTVDQPLHLWIRAECRPTEQRAPIVPADAARLVAEGVRVTVEESSQRAFALEEYRAAGCEIAPAGSWSLAPSDVHVVGIKELPLDPIALDHPHIYFAHAYKGQTGAEETLSRFHRGSGELLDVEYLTSAGRRVVAFGRWAGYVGAALGVLEWRGETSAPLAPTDKPTLDARLREGAPLRALVIGSRGRSGEGAMEALAVAGAEVTRWDRAETAELDREALLDHDLLVNCVVSHSPAPPFVRTEDLDAPRRLRVVADVTCDVTSENNLLPINTAITTWDEPVREVGSDGASMRVIAIDNLPSLLPREASESFSAELTPLMEDLPGREGAWRSAVEMFQRHRAD